MKTVHRIMFFVVLLPIVLGAWGTFTACKSAPPLPEPDVVEPDSGPGPAPSPAPPAVSCLTAADHLHEIGCAEASDAGAFAHTCAQVQAWHLTRVDVPCMIAAKTKAEARACPGVTCL